MVLADKKLGSKWILNIKGSLNSMGILKKETKKKNSFPNFVDIKIKPMIWLNTVYA